ncbi:M46 protein [Murid betaherpesvirus 1]|uniref:Minor capsid protein n=7 Tax=Muromegalovirus muridbeta1 TaxID=3050323 RepID=D3XDN4_MUHVS|nr:minor capsid protein [Murid betaherpesvirus 1]YP_214059.1 Minor capsid protein [Murid betaherpesvirus 1]6NHJ_S Chain S, Minor capsid protein [Murine cytomegalovirus (strain Smith)]6NHJ_T Chain T, Minor capsid protein [Murine cytomegalovirus (strain Smith)]6NHJ_U Chain U, Minor capsid protein [Murine cytomegalovirus (strain Smith)]6NHJ_V Chain V, Minor capsid protein [Murine cytomegalovirus (strain Smith)]6NHJ_y Chain y, Minor capsid protein [Murine cytomegalovirus (strain Smith)]ACE95232.
MANVSSFGPMKREVMEFDPEDPYKVSKMRKLERSIAKGYVYGADHQAITARFFVRESLGEVEQKNLGVLMFRLDTGIEMPSTVLVSLFFLSMVAENVSAATKNTLAAIYGREGEAIRTWLRDGAWRLHRVVHPLGCTNSITPGATCLITCSMRGHSYNMLKTEIYPLLVPKEIYLDLDGESTDEIRFVYFVITYDYNSDRQGRPSAFVVVSRITHRHTLINVLRYRFRVSRFHFLNNSISGYGPSTGCLGTLQRLGWFCSRDSRSGIVASRAGQLSVVKLEKFYVDVGPLVEFA